MLIIKKRAPAKSSTLPPPDPLPMGTSCGGPAVWHRPHTRRDHRIDYPGAVALIVFLVPLLIVAEQGRTWGWSSTSALVCYVLGVVGFVLFVLAERAYEDEALLPLRLFTNRTFAVSGLSSIVLGMGMFGGILLLP